MTSTMPGSISGSRLMPSIAFFKKPFAHRAATTTAVPSTEQRVAEEAARNRLLPIVDSALGVASRSL